MKVLSGELQTLDRAQNICVTGVAVHSNWDGVFFVFDSATHQQLRRLERVVHRGCKAECPTSFQKPHMASGAVVQEAAALDAANVVGTATSCRLEVE